jgi:DNA polymerase-3 subunit delta'
MSSPKLTNIGSELPCDIQGHDDFLAGINTSLSNGRMHHAWLITGPVGIGKASMAKLAAARLLSEKAHSGALFDTECSDLKIDAEDVGTSLVMRGVHPDFKITVPQTEGNKSGQIKIDQIRELTPFMMHKPSRGGWRVAIIDSMDDVNLNGANALLKLLEEPPKQAVFFLIASNIGHLPPTIRSRCRLVRMSRLAPDACMLALGRIWPDADRTQLEILSKLSQGAPGQAVKLANSGAADLYQDTCALLQSKPLNQSTLANLCAKWGRGAAAGREIRAGAVFCIDRLLRHAALRASQMKAGELCSFEIQVIERLASGHSAEQLARFHNEFVTNAARAERLNLDFSRFLERHLSKIYEKSLP